MRNYYSDYVGHMMRQYLRLNDSSDSELSETTQINIDICDTALKRLPETERELLLAVYSNGTNLREGVNISAESKGIREKTVWAMVKNFEKEIATERGLT